jgi:hypothetical protein
MQELLPLSIGLILGCLCLPVGSVYRRSSTAVLLSFVGGALATTINGEWWAGLLPFLADVALVATGALAVLIVRSVLRQLSRLPQSVEPRTK